MFSRIIICLILCSVYLITMSFYLDYTLSSRTELSSQQLNEGVIATEVRTNQRVQNTVWPIGWIVIFGVSVFILRKDIMNLKKLMCFGLVSVSLFSSGCWRPFEPIKLEEIKPYEEAFLIPYTGDAKKQSSSNTEEYLKENLVYTKQVRIPQQWVQTGFETMGANGEWRDAAVLIKVDKSPVTREWTADANSGTSNRNEAIWVMTSDQVEFSTGWTITARLASRDDSIKFLHNYSNGSLKTVLDTEVRSKLQALFGLEVTDLPMDELRKAATPHIVKVTNETTEFFKNRGIQITNIGITGGFVYKDKTILDTMVEVFNAEQQKNIAAAGAAAQEERNKMVRSTAEGKAQALLTEKEAEAKGIKMVADAKGYEIEKSQQDKATYVQLKALEIQKSLLEKWDGKYPTTFMGQSTPASILMPAPNIGKE